MSFPISLSQIRFGRLPIPAMSRIAFGHGVATIPIVLFDPDPNFQEAFRQVLTAPKYDLTLFRATQSIPPNALVLVDQNAEGAEAFLVQHQLPENRVILIGSKAVSGLSYRWFDKAQMLITGASGDDAIHNSEKFYRFESALKAAAEGA